MFCNVSDDQVLQDAQAVHVQQATVPASEVLCRYSLFALVYTMVRIGEDTASVVLLGLERLGAGTCFLHSGVNWVGCGSLAGLCFLLIKIAE